MHKPLQCGRAGWGSHGKRGIATMVRAAALVAGDGARLQAILDSMYFKEIPNFELVAVICPQRDAYVMKRALNAGVPAYVVDPELFPTMTSHSMAVANKLKDRAIDSSTTLTRTPFMERNAVASVGMPALIARRLVCTPGTINPPRNSAFSEITL